MSRVSFLSVLAVLALPPAYGQNNKEFAADYDKEMAKAVSDFASGRTLDPAAAVKRLQDAEKDGNSKKKTEKKPEGEAAEPPKQDDDETAAKIKEFEELLKDGKAVQNDPIRQSGPKTKDDPTNYATRVLTMSSRFKLSPENENKALDVYVNHLPQTKFSSGGQFKAQPPQTEEEKKLAADQKKNFTANTRRTGANASNIANILNENRAPEYLGSRDFPVTPGEIGARPRDPALANRPAAQLPASFRHSSAAPNAPAQAQTPPVQPGLRERYERAKEEHKEYWNRRAEGLEESGTNHLIAAMDPNTPWYKKAYHYTAAAGTAIAQGGCELAALKKETWQHAAVGAAVGASIPLVIAAAAPTALTAIGVTGVATTSTAAAGGWGLAAGLTKAAATATTVYMAPTAFRNVADTPTIGNGVIAAVSVAPIPGLKYATEGVLATRVGERLLANAALGGGEVGMTAAFKMAAQKTVHGAVHLAADGTAEGMAHAGGHGVDRLLGPETARAAPPEPGVLTTAAH